MTRNQGKTAQPDRPRAYLIAAGVVLASVALAYLLQRLMPHASLALLFLTGVVIVAARTGTGPALLAGVVSFLAYNLLFTAPYYTFVVADEDELLTLVFFLLMAVITGNLAARMHSEIASRRAALQRMSNLYEFSRQMSSETVIQDVYEALAGHLANSLDTSVAVLVASPGGAATVLAASGPVLPPGEALSATAWLPAKVKPKWIDGWMLLELNPQRGPEGRIAVHGQPDGEQLELARSLCAQAALALDRIHLVVDIEQVRLVSETEQLRSALLSSISHDLRTPLASIIGSTTSLLEYGAAFSAEDRHDLLATVVEEAQRLDRHIQNLLDMTRLGHGSLKLQRDWVDLHDIIASAVNRLRDVLKGLPVDVEIAEDVPLLRVHGVLIEQALVNLLDNAVRFSPPDGRIRITARPAGEQVVIELCDDGPGIPEEEREKIFDMFYTVRQGDRSHLQGTGLGLAICRGMIGAHGGSVTAHDGRQGCGTCMRIVLPANGADEA